MLSNNKVAILIAVLSVLIAIFVNELNLKSLRKQGVELRQNQTIQTNDDYSYLNPVKNLIETGSFYVNDVQKYNTIIRSPGYGLTHFVLAKVFGTERALFYQKLFQVVLFGLSIYCFLFIALSVLASRTWAIIVTGIYGLLPFSMGFLYYTLTEAITPALTVFYVYFLIKAFNNNTNKKSFLYLIASLLFAYLFLTRPVLGILGLAIPFFIWKDYHSSASPFRIIKYMLVFGIASISFMLIWQVRNYQVLGRISSLHPIYQNELPGMFRPTHKAIWELFKGWESRGDKFHDAIGPLWTNAISGDTASIHIETMIGKIPDDVVDYFGEDRLAGAFKLYQLSTFDQIPFYEQNLTMPSTPLASEMEVIAAFNQMKREYKKHFWFQYHIITPAKVYKNMIFHSNLSLYIFQFTYRGSFFMEAIRWICFIIHVATFILIPFILLSDVNKQYKLLFGIGVLIYLFYLVYFQRGIEERYTLPVLPLILLGSAKVIKDGIARIGSLFGGLTGKHIR